ncbi:MAG: hypothetical protein Q9219_002474 [cf. Caloplaca sp. 3 TL-2023]
MTAEIPRSSFSLDNRLGAQFLGYPARSLEPLVQVKLGEPVGRLMTGILRVSVDARKETTSYRKRSSNDQSSRPFTKSLTIGAFDWAPVESTSLGNVNAIAAYGQTVAERDRNAQQCLELERELQLLQTDLHAERGKVRSLHVELEAVKSDLRQVRGTTTQTPFPTIQGPRDTGPLPTRNDAIGTRFVEDFGFGPKPVGNIPSDPREGLYIPQVKRIGYQPEERPGRLGQPDSRNVKLGGPSPGELEQVVAWPAEFSNLFSKVERFCSDYLNIPNEDADRKWPLGLADTIVRESHPDHVFSLAGDRRTRHLLLTRVILSWVEAHCFHIKIIKGFSKDTDEAVYQLHRRAKSEKSIAGRRGLAQAEANQIREVTEHSHFAAWKTQRIRDDVNKMVDRLRDTIVPGMNLTLLGNTFESILSDAWRIGLLMASSTSDFHMWFPPSSYSTVFNPRCMLNRNPYGLQGTPDEWEKRGARVVLGITPHVTVQDIMTDNMETKTVHMATVILREG